MIIDVTKAIGRLIIKPDTEVLLRVLEEDTPERGEVVLVANRLADEYTLPPLAFRVEECKRVKWAKIAALWRGDAIETTVRRRVAILRGEFLLPRSTAGVVVGDPRLDQLFPHRDFWDELRTDPLELDRGPLHQATFEELDDLFVAPDAMRFIRESGMLVTYEPEDAPWLDDDERARRRKRRDKR